MSKNPPPKRRRSSKRCVFCGNTGVSKEHVFGEWLQKLIPRSTGRGQDFLRYTQPAPDGRAVHESRVRMNQGDLLTIKVREVCKPCNNRWMGGLETRVKPILAPLLDDSSCDLTHGSVRSLATWAAKSAITIGYTDRETMCIPLKHRQWLMEHDEPPPNTTIWLARREEDVTVEVAMRSVFLGTSQDELSQLRDEPGNTYMLVFSLRRVCIFVFGTTLTDHVMSPTGEQSQCFVQLWPNPEPLTWPLQPSISSEFIHAWLNAYVRHFEAVAFRLGSMPLSEGFPIRGGTPPSL